MKKQIISSLILASLLAQACNAHEYERETPTEITIETATLAESVPAPTAAHSERSSYIPLSTCLTQPRALLKCPAGVAACLLTLLKACSLAEAVYFSKYDYLGQATCFAEIIVAGYLTNWFIKDFLKTCRKEVAQRLAAEDTQLHPI